MSKWNRDSIVDAIKRFHSENNRIPSNKDFESTRHYPSRTAVVYHFGSWNKAIESAGLEPIGKRYSKEELLQSLRTFFVKHGRPPKLAECSSEFGMPSFDTYQEQYGSFNKAIAAAGFKTRHSTSLGEKKHTDAELIALLEEKVKVLGFIPVTAELRRVEPDGGPNGASYIRQFGSLYNAMQQTSFRYNRPKYWLRTWVGRIKMIVIGGFDWLQQLLRENIS